MAIQTLSTIKSWFKTALKPTQAQFWDTWDSFRHKLEKIPVSEIENLETIINDKVSTGELNNHTTNPLAHADLFDKKADAEALKEHMEGGQAHWDLFEQKVDKEDGMGLSQEDFTSELKEKLEGLGGVPEIPSLQQVIDAGEDATVETDRPISFLTEDAFRVESQTNIVLNSHEALYVLGLKTNNNTTHLLGFDPKDHSVSLTEKSSLGAGSGTVPTLDAVLTAGSTSTKLLTIQSPTSSTAKVVLDGTLGISVHGTGSRNYARYRDNSIVFNPVNGSGSLTINVNTFSITDNYVQNVQLKSGTIALLSDLEVLTKRIEDLEILLEKK